MNHLHNTYYYYSFKIYHVFFIIIQSDQNVMLQKWWKLHAFLVLTPIVKQNVIVFIGYIF